MKHAAALGLGLALLLGGQAQAASPLPKGVKAVWDLRKAYHETTPTRERICLNGLWRWQPAQPQEDRVPAADWGFFKVPGCWPGITDYMQKDCQEVYGHPNWNGRELRDVTAAWYQRELSIPRPWTGRRMLLHLEYLNSYAVVFLDGRRIGELRFPGGDLDITSVCRPGATHLLSLLVVALPLKGVLLSYTDSASAREVKGSVPRRGLCGDVFLVSLPARARLGDARADTSVRQEQIGIDTAVEGLAPRTSYSVLARVLDHGRLVKEFASPFFAGDDVVNGHITFNAKWLPPKLWDTITPTNLYEMELSLLDTSGKVLDIAWPFRFGFREFWIQGQDFYLNGSRIYLSAVPLDNAEVSAATATYESTRESLERLKSIGINFVYTHNYGCEPGSHLSFAEALRAADDAGMLVGFSQPHFSHYDWQGADADRTNGYARDAAFYVSAARHHPSVVCYAMSHNATGYSEDMNPDMIDGIQDDRDSWATKNAALALRAEAIVEHLDPSRIVYHHASGNLGAMHAINFYPNFVPPQELSDWFEHWSKDGVKPVFLCEYGAPFTWDWTMYRGWYKGQREFGGAAVPWEFSLAEWNAQFLGDRAFDVSGPEQANLRWEAKQFRAGNVWHRWDYPYEVGSSRFEERYPIFALYLKDNWRAFRAWGVSAISPWEYGHYWTLRPAVDRGRRDFKVDWENLQHPGFSPDYLDQRYERMDLAFDQLDWMPTPAARALIANNGPLLAFIAGKPQAFTSQDHNFLPGETVEKQLILINNSRRTVTANCEWTLALPQPASGRRELTLPTGQQERIAWRFELPAALPPGQYALRATVRFSTGETQADRLTLDVLPPPPRARVSARIALFDPTLETAPLLTRLGIPNQPVGADTDLSGYDLLIVGKSALTPSGPAPDITHVRNGLKVLVFEQNPETLESRFGFRVAQYGLRWVFPRVPDNPVLAGLTPDSLRNWRGASTLLPPRLKYEMRPRYGPTVQWCGLPVTRLWRCGNRGDVASVLIEKPACGDFLPLLDGGFDLQYSPLLEYREGQGLVVFCQLDVTDRTENDPAADTLVANLLQYIDGWKPAARRPALYVGDPAEKHELDGLGFSLGAAESPTLQLTPDQLLVVGPGGGLALSNRADVVSRFLDAGGNVLALGLDRPNLKALLPFILLARNAEHISCYFDAPGRGSVFAGIGPADVQNRDPRELPLISAAKADVLGDGVLASAGKDHVVLCQLTPAAFTPATLRNLKRTHRHVCFLMSRLLSNLGVDATTPVLDRFHRAVDPSAAEKRWLTGLYVDQPEEWDDPYRFFRW